MLIKEGGDNSTVKAPDKAGNGIQGSHGRIKGDTGERWNNDVWNCVPEGGLCEEATPNSSVFLTGRDVCGA